MVCSQSRIVLSQAVKKRKEYAFRRQYNEKPSIIPGCPVQAVNGGVGGAGQVRDLYTIQHHMTNQSSHKLYACHLQSCGCFCVASTASAICK